LVDIATYSIVPLIALPTGLAVGGLCVWLDAGGYFDHIKMFQRIFLK